MAKEVQIVNGILTGVDNPNDISCFVPGVPTVSMLMVALLPVRSFTLPINLTGSRADAAVAATGSTTFTIKKGVVDIGTIVFAPAATTGTFTLPSATSFTNTDKLTVVAPVVPDGTLADISFTLAGTR